MDDRIEARSISYLTEMNGPGISHPVSHRASNPDPCGMETRFFPPPSPTSSVPSLHLLSKASGTHVQWHSSQVSDL